MWPAIKMLVAGTHITGTAVSWAQWNLMYSTSHHHMFSVRLA